MHVTYVVFLDAQVDSIPTLSITLDGEGLLIENAGGDGLLGGGDGLLVSYRPISSIILEEPWPVSMSSVRSI